MFQYLQIFYRPGLFIEEIVHQAKNTYLRSIGSLFCSVLLYIPIIMSTGIAGQSRVMDSFPLRSLLVEFLA